MADSLSPFPPSPRRRSPSRSPHQHTLRPRRSLYSSSFSSKPGAVTQLAESSNSALRSPLRLADDKANVVIPYAPAASKAKGRGGAMLFPASPEPVAVVREARPVREQAGLKKLATSLSGAFTAKGRGARAKQGFDLSDWNYDLAAIASDPSSSAASASSPPLPTSSSRRQAAPPPVAIPPVRASYVSPNDLVTPTTPHFPSFSANHGTAALIAALELPTTTTTETRRRKSDEMEDEDRASFQVPAPPVRREGLHSRSHSLAHAHTLRSSRTLSHHASFGDSPRHTPTASTSAHVFAASPGFSNPSPSTKARATKESGDHHPYNFGAEPPSKKMSVEGLGSIADQTADESDEDSEEEEANSVFGYGGTISSTGAKKTGRAISFSRPSNSLLTVPPITSSSSHPGWTGDGFGIALPRVARFFNGSLSADSSRPRTRTASAASALDTLSEAGPAVDSFSVPLRDGLERLSAADKGKNVMTPPRRRSEGFSLFGNSMGGTGVRRTKMEEGGKRGSLPDMTMRDEGDMGETDSPRRLQATQGARRVVPDLLTPNTLPLSASTDSAFPSPSRRATSVDSLFLASVLQGPTASPFNRPGTITTPNGHREPIHTSVHNLRDFGGGRKRNANGALLVGQSVVAGSNLAAVSPIVAGSSSSPAPWNARDTFGEMDEDDDDEDAMEDDVDWGGNLSPPPPALTDGTTSASSSLSTSLSSHAEGDHASLVGTSRSLSLSNIETGPFFTPQNYKHVRPLQAAFMSTGLVSKRSRARNDSGVGLGLTPSFNLQHQLQQQLDDSLDAAHPVEIPSANPLVTTVSRTSIMPDTPVKKAAFAHPSTVTSSPEILVNAIRAPISSSPNPKPSPTTARKSISPRGSSEGLGGVASPCSGRSPMRSPAESENGQQGGDVSPTVHASRSGSKSVAGSAWKRPAMFRRRSSGQLSMEAGFLGGLRSGSSEGSTTTSLAVDGEPMTPTRSVGRWGEGACCFPSRRSKVADAFLREQARNSSPLLPTCPCPPPSPPSLSSTSSPSLPLPPSPLSQPSQHLTVAASPSPCPTSSASSTPRPAADDRNSSSGIRDRSSSLFDSRSCSSPAGSRRTILFCARSGMARSAMRLR